MCPHRVVFLMTNVVSLRMDHLKKKQLQIGVDCKRLNPSFFEQYVFASVEWSN